MPAGLADAEKGGSRASSPDFLGLLSSAQDWAARLMMGERRKKGSSRLGRDRKILFRFDWNLNGFDVICFD